MACGAIARDQRYTIDFRTKFSRATPRKIFFSNRARRRFRILALVTFVKRVYHVRLTANIFPRVIVPPPGKDLRDAEIMACWNVQSFDASREKFAAKDPERIPDKLIIRDPRSSNRRWRRDKIRLSTGVDKLVRNSLR